MDIETLCAVVLIGEIALVWLLSGYLNELERDGEL